MSYSELVEARWKLESQLRDINQKLEEYIYVECYICKRPDIGQYGIPEQWGWLKETHILLCNECIERWTAKFITPPDVYKEGDDIL